MPYRLIDPDETLDYSCDWTDFLEDAGSPTDAIQSSTWSVTRPLLPCCSAPSTPVISNSGASAAPSGPAAI